MSDKFTKNTAYLKAAIGDIDVLRTDRLQAVKIQLKGENLDDILQDLKDSSGLQTATDYPKLISRVELPEDSNYILWTDSGNPVYISFADKLTKGYYEGSALQGLFIGNMAITTFDIDLPALEYAGNMFYQCENLVSFTGDISSLKYGCVEQFIAGSGGGMFENCKNLKVFTSSLKNLESGMNMFNGCKLNKESVLSIIRSIKQENLYSGEDAATLTLGVDKNIISDEELLSELGITYVEGTTYYTSVIESFAGGQWNLSISFN